VNSLHSQGIDVLSERLVVEAVADDGLIEAVSWRPTGDKSDCWILGVQWHPEWQFELNKVSKAIFHEFGQQIRNTKQAKPK
jgi:putative glutamine amidotransferase